MADYAGFELIKRGKMRPEGVEARGKSLFFPADHTLGVSADHANVRICGKWTDRLFEESDKVTEGPFTIELIGRTYFYTVSDPEQPGEAEYLNPPSYPALLKITDLTDKSVFTVRTFHLTLRVSDGNKIEVTRLDRSDLPGGPRGARIAYYGCPTADETEGVVSESMLTEFEGFSDVEL